MANRIHEFGQSTRERFPLQVKHPLNFFLIDRDGAESKDFVLLCLLCAFLVQGVFRGKHTWQVVEFFSGKARLSRLAAKCGYPVASFELENDPGFRNREKTSKHPFPHRSFMDFNGESGFAPLNSNLLLLSPCIPCHIL